MSFQVQSERTKLEVSEAGITQFEGCKQVIPEEGMQFSPPSPENTSRNAPPRRTDLIPHSVCSPLLQSLSHNLNVSSSTQAQLCPCWISQSLLISETKKFA